MISNEPMTGAEAFITLLLALITIAFIIGMVFRAPKLVAVGFIGVLFMFSDATYGALEVQASIYGRGVGIFYFSLLHLGLLVAGFAVLCKKLAAPGGNPPLAPALSKWFIALVALMAAHVVAGLMQGVDLYVILGYNGFMNVINMLVLMYVVVEGFKNDGDKEKLLYTIIGLAAVRALFGLVRYAAFGGDPANPYKNFDNLDIKLVFFEIGDNYVVSVGAFCAAWLLMTPQARLSGLKRLALFGLLILQIAAVALSYRRSSLVGLGLMFALLVYRLPARQKVVVSLFAAGFLTAIAAVFFQSRLQYAGNSGEGILSSLVFDIARDSVEESRFYELYAAAKSLSGNWLTGLGSWGTFTGDDELLFYHGGRYDFVHSGFGHMVLKSGIIGLVLFCGLIWAYTAHYFKSRKYLSGNALLIADAGFAGFLFWIPTLLIGTPLIEIRTMLLLGFTLALPFIAVRLESYRPQVYNNNYTPQYAAAA
jgi:hypothetical protein